MFEKTDLNSLNKPLPITFFLFNSLFPLLSLVHPSFFSLSPLPPPPPPPPLSLSLSLSLSRFPSFPPVDLSFNLPSFILSHKTHSILLKIDIPLSTLLHFFCKNRHGEKKIEKFWLRISFSVQNYNAQDYFKSLHTVILSYHVTFDCVKWCFLYQLYYSFITGSRWGPH